MAVVLLLIYNTYKKLCPMLISSLLLLGWNGGFRRQVATCTMVFMEPYEFPLKEAISFLYLRVLGHYPNEKTKRFPER